MRRARSSSPVKISERSIHALNQLLDTHTRTSRNPPRTHIKMSREEYQIPTSAADHGPKSYEPVGAKTANLVYICGDCGVKSSDHQTVPF
ncbi:unnamed protein product [Parascedosporium putredinis]|uniref:Uncharacterized protein n=1 Tax=Parascedosporium putredinis TaxID=1442378 RepID=A0A9P1GX41_9PEZI|nr:unnamed protein product [Parascedosporium putredinis]CAI7989433.1 unnamed protein product [Parascedosporium putredinis]